MADAYARLARLYDPVMSRLNRTLLSVALRTAGPDENSRVLDVGCGTGSWLEMFADEGCRCTGLDLSPSMLDQAEKRLGDRADLTLGDATDMPFDDASFDIVVASLFLHELSPGVRRDVLWEMRRVTADGGSIVTVEFGTAPLDTRGRVLRAVSMIFERIAGREHKQNCEVFLTSGGIPAVAASVELDVSVTRNLGGGNTAIHVLVPRP